MAKLTYEDKEFLNKNENIADKNKVNDSDLNEIKNVVNENADSVGNLSNLNTTDKTSLVNAINEVNNKSAITVMVSENKQYAQNNYLVVDAYNEIINQIGNNITMTSNGVFKVNKGMNLFLSFYNNIQPRSANQLIMYRVTVNNEDIYSQAGFECGNQWGNSGQTLAPFVLKLNKNDTVSIKLYASENTCTVRASSYITLIEI